MGKKKWIFDTKVVRAIKCEKYGDQYTACCQLNISCGVMYIDSMIATNGESLKKSDLLEIVKYAKSVDVTTIYYHRIIGNKKVLKKVDLCKI